MSGWRFKTAAHSSKMLTKRHRLYRLAGQLAQAREGFAVAPGPCLSGSPPLLMAAARAGRVSQRWSDMIGWRFKTAVCPLIMSHLHCPTSPLRPVAINRGLEPAGHGPCATAKLSPLKFCLHGSLHRRWRVLNSLLERAALLFTHVALTLPLSYTRYPVGQRAFLWRQPRHKACQRPPSAREAARSTCKHSLFTSPSPHLPIYRNTPRPPVGSAPKSTIEPASHCTHTMGVLQ